MVYLEYPNRNNVAYIVFFKLYRNYQEIHTFSCGRSDVDI